MLATTNNFVASADRPLITKLFRLCSGAILYLLGVGDTELDATLVFFFSNSVRTGLFSSKVVGVICKKY